MPGRARRRFPRKLTRAPVHCERAPRRVRGLRALRVLHGVRARARRVAKAHESLDAKFEGTDLTVAFNPEYLAQGIEVAPGDEVTIETVDALKPALLRCPDHPDFLYLLMPVRVS